MKRSRNEEGMDHRRGKGSSCSSAKRRLLFSSSVRDKEEEKDATGSGFRNKTKKVEEPQTVEQGDDMTLHNATGANLRAGGRIGRQLILDTPQKKKGQRGDNDDDNDEEFLDFGPNRQKKGPIVTPEQPHDKFSASSTTTKGKRKLEYKMHQPIHVPTHIHKNVRYQRKGQALLDEKLKRAYDFVEGHFIIPKDFEQNRSYGPLSGTCYEERVVRCYNLSLLEPKQAKFANLEFCSNCSVVGHKKDDCPDLI